MNQRKKKTIQTCSPSYAQVAKPRQHLQTKPTKSVVDAVNSAARHRRVQTSLQETPLLKRTTMKQFS
jgi:uridine kinase